MTDKKVHSITDHRHLLEWLEERLLASEPKRPINTGLVETGFFILEEVKGSRCFQVDTDMWGERLDAIFSSMVDSTSAPFYPNSLIGFISTVYGEVLEHGEITIEDTNRILIEILLYREQFLRIHRVGKCRYLESTAKCLKKFGTTVCETASARAVAQVRALRRGRSGASNVTRCERSCGAGALSR